MPACDAQYMLSYLWQIGPVMNGGMSAAPITHEEMLAWQALNGIELAPWESHTLRGMSIAYLNESNAATKRDAHPPWTPEDSARADFSSVQKSLRNLANL